MVWPIDIARVGLDDAKVELQTGEDPAVSCAHDLVALGEGRLVQMKGIGVLHQKLARAHDAEPGPDLVAKLGLDLVVELREAHQMLREVREEDPNNPHAASRPSSSVAEYMVDDTIGLYLTISFTVALGHDEEVALHGGRCVVQACHVAGGDEVERRVGGEAAGPRRRTDSPTRARPRSRR